MNNILFRNFTWKSRGLRHVVCVLLCAAMLLTGALAASAISYADVADDEPLAAVIDKVSSEGLFEGSGGRFKADKPFTRAMMSKVLQRLSEGQIKAFATQPVFDDVADGIWYMDSSYAMVYMGMLNPKQDALFHPDMQLSREQFAAFLYGFLRFEGLDGSNPYEITDLPDLNDIDPACRDAVSWALSSGVLRVSGDGSFVPKGLLNRGDAALAFSRYLELDGE